MPVALYLDVHVDKAIHDQLRLCGVEVLRAQEDGAAELLDEEVLKRATDLGRVVFTQDVGFKAMAVEWQRHGRKFAGLTFGNQLGVTIGTYVRDLELIAKATDPAEWFDVVQHCHSSEQTRPEFRLENMRSLGVLSMPSARQSGNCQTRTNWS